MGNVSVTTIASETETITKDKLNGLAGNLVTEFNGKIDNDNIKANAGIVGSKLDLSAPGIIGGTTPAAITGTTITGDTIDGVIGSVTPAAGTFTTLSATGGISETIADEGNVVALEITQSDVTNNPIAVQIENDGTNHCLYVKQDGDLAAGDFGFYVYSNTAQTNSFLTKVFQDSATSSQVMSVFENDSNKGAVYVQQDGVLDAGNYALYIYSNAEQTNSNLATMVQDNASSSVGVLLIQNDCSKYGIAINAAGNGPHINLFGDPTVASSSDGDIWFDGTNLKMNKGGTVYNINMTAA